MEGLNLFIEICSAISIACAVFLMKDILDDLKAPKKKLPWKK